MQEKMCIYTHFTHPFSSIHLCHVGVVSTDGSCVAVCPGRILLQTGLHC